METEQFYRSVNTIEQYWEQRDSFSIKASYERRQKVHQLKQKEKQKKKKDTDEKIESALNNNRNDDSAEVDQSQNNNTNQNKNNNNQERQLVPNLSPENNANEEVR